MTDGTEGAVDAHRRRLFDALRERGLDAVQARRLTSEVFLRVAEEAVARDAEVDPDGVRDRLDAHLESILEDYFRFVQDPPERSRFSV